MLDCGVEFVVCGGLLEADVHVVFQCLLIGDGLHPGPDGVEYGKRYVVVSVDLIKVLSVGEGALPVDVRLLKGGG